MASIAQIIQQMAAATPIMDGVAAVGTSLKAAREDHVHASDTTRYKSGDDVSFGTLGAGATTVTSLTDSGLTITRIPFASTAGLLIDNDNLNWDNANKRVAIGTETPLYKLDIRGTTSLSQLHFASSNADSGGYLVSAGIGNFFVAAGASFNATNWVAKNTAAAIIGGGPTNNGTLTFYTDSALTIGNIFAPTQRMTLDTSGRLGIGVLSPTAILHLPAGTATAGTAPLKFTAGVITTAAVSGQLETDPSNNLYYTNAVPTRGQVPLATAANKLFFTTTGDTSVTLPMAGTLAILGANTFTADQTYAGNNIFNTVAKGVVLKQGANGLCGTFVLTGVTPVTVANSSIAITDVIMFSLNTVGGTVGMHPSILTITAGVGFTVAGTALDTSTMNYAIIKNAA